MASHAKSAASRTARATSVPAMIVLVMTAPVTIVLAVTVLKVIAHKATVHALMKAAAKPLVIAMVKASAISPHAKARSHAGKPALKAAVMTASHPSLLLAKRPSAASPSASAALAHAVGLMLVVAATALSCHVAAARNPIAHTRSGP